VITTLTYRPRGWLKSRTLNGMQTTAYDYDGVGQLIKVVGKITNMVTGQAKQLLSEKGVDFDMPRPTVILGEQHLDMIGVLPAIVVPFSCEQGEFYVEICFTPDH
jgi:YD repeat-containing protein